MHARRSIWKTAVSATLIAVCATFASPHPVQAQPAKLSSTATAATAATPANPATAATPATRASRITDDPPQALDLGEGTVSYVGEVQVVTPKVESLPLGMRQAIERDLNTTPEQYLRDSALSQAAARTSDYLAAAYPEQILGGWAEGDGITIAATTPEAREAIAALGVTARTAPHSFAELDAAASALLAGGRGDVLVAGVDIRSGGLVATLADGASLPDGVVPSDIPVQVSTGGTPENYDDVAPDWSGSYELRNGRGIYTGTQVDGLDPQPSTWKPTDNSDEAWNTYVDVTVPLINSVGLGLCSLGFGARGDGSVGGDTRPYVLTAGHCVADDEGKSWIWSQSAIADEPTLKTRGASLPNPNTGEGGTFSKYVGAPTYYQLGGGKDVVGNPKIGNWPGTPNTDATLIPIEAASGLSPSNQVWTYPTTKDDNPPTNIAVTGLANPVAGDSVCHSGGVSGWHCGEVVLANALWYGGVKSGAIFGMTVKMCATNGDSGGATVMGTSAVGLLQGGTSGAAFPEGAEDCLPDSNHTSLVASTRVLQPALDTVGVRILQDVAPPVITAPAADATLDAGLESYTVTGTAIAGDTVTLALDGVDLGETPADPVSGAWSFTLTNPKSGQHTLKAQSVRDPVNHSAAVTTAFTVATVAPPVVTSPAAGAVLPATTTLDIVGTAAQGDTVSVYVDGQLVGSVEVTAASGQWTLAGVEVAAGEHTLETQATRGAVNASTRTTSTFTVTALSDAPLIKSPVAGSTLRGDTTTFTASGTAAPGQTVTVSVDGATLGTATAQADGTWTLANLPTETGDHTLTAVATRADGTQTPEASATFSVRWEFDAPGITEPATTLPPAESVTLAGTASADQVVALTLNGTFVGSARADASGAWTLPQVAVTPGQHTVTAWIGTETAPRSPAAELMFTVQARATAPVITRPTPQQVLPIGTVSTDLAGTATAGDTVIVTLDGRAVGSPRAGADGAWSIPAVAVEEGEHVVTAIAERNENNRSEETTSLFSVTPRASAPTFTSPAEAAVLRFGTLTVTVSGTGTAGDLISLQPNDGPALTATVSPTRTWSIADVPLTVGVNTLAATAARGEGNVSEPATLTVRVDGPAETPVITSPAEGAVLPATTMSITVKGTATPGDLVAVTLEGVAVGTVTTNGTGAWSLADLPVTAGANHTLTAQAQRGSTNTSGTLTRTFSVLPRAAAPTITSPTAGAVLPLGSTQTTITGTATAGDRVDVSVNGGSPRSVTAAADGTWSLANVPVAGGTNTLTAVAHRSDGNVSLPTVVQITVQERSAAPVISTPAAGSTLPAGTTTVTVTGRATPGDIVYASIGQGAAVRTTAAADGTWRVAGLSVQAGLLTVSAYAQRPGTLPSPTVRHTFTVEARAVPTLFRTATSDVLYRLTGSGASTRAVPISFAEWASYGYPAPRLYPSAYVKYAWSNDVYAVNFWHTDPSTWTWQRLTLADWQRAGYPRPGIAGWIAGTTAHKWGTNDELFAVLNGTTHKLSFAEWQAMGYLPFTNRANEGFAKTPGSNVLYRMTSLSGNRGVPLTLPQWIAQSFPTPRTIPFAPRP
ncbi:hypothetical protein JT358_05645 [Micrococcales bacterium 31B]|nr:hypothetical protein [Micrococcales bacterium 31B]